MGVISVVMLFLSFFNGAVAVKHASSAPTYASSSGAPVHTNDGTAPVPLCPSGCKK